jgi:ABC-type siderophore export system fused ATPase/permease subunit
MTTVNVSEETRVRLANKKTYELSSVDKIINNALDQSEGIIPVVTPAQIVANQQAQTEEAEEPEEDAEQKCRAAMEAAEKV